jgi:hypothetical protein
MESKFQTKKEKSNDFSISSVNQQNPFINNKSKENIDHNQKEPNTVAKQLPNNIKTNAEHLSGIALDDVRVHYNSPEPEKLSSYAFAKGSNIHISSGQEQHLPHEAWHVVQQKQGKVSSTQQVNGTSINDDASLESEATQMGDKAMRSSTVLNETNTLESITSDSNVAQLAAKKEEEERKGFFGRTKNFLGNKISNAKENMGPKLSGAKNYLGYQLSNASDLAKTQLGGAKQYLGDKFADARSFASSKLTEAKEHVKENKVSSAVTGVGTTNSIVAKSLSLAGHATAGTMQSGIGGAVTDAFSAAKGGKQVYKNWQESSRLKDELGSKPKKGEEGYSAEERAALRLQKQDKDDATAKGASQTLSGALKSSGKITTASGVAAPVGMALGAAGYAVDGASALGGMAVQSQRDKNARRLRNDEDILADKAEKNIERQKKVEGSNFNPMNWYAKVSNAVSGDDPEKKIGINKGLSKEEIESNNQKYLERKHEMYAGEGYDIKKDQDGRVQGDITKKTKSWFPWGKETTKTYDEEEQIVTKGLSSKATAARLEEEKKKQKEEKGSASLWPFKK